MTIKKQCTAERALRFTHTMNWETDADAFSAYCIKLYDSQNLYNHTETIQEFLGPLNVTKLYDESVELTRQKLK